MKSIYYKFPFVDVPNSLKPFVGKPDPGTRMYRAEGSDEEMVVWFDKLHDHFDRLVSPGGVSIFVPASPNARDGRGAGQQPHSAKQKAKRQ